MERPRNRLLAGLPDGDFKRVASKLDRVSLHEKQLLHHQGEQMDAVYFPNGGVISIVTVLSNGVCIEGATIGREGMVGIPAFFADFPVSPFESMVQVPDTDGFVLGMQAFRAELARFEALHAAMERYVQVVIAQMMQSNACNAVHSVPQRCARWLLTVRDHVEADEFQLSQEFLAQMLAVQRATVSDVAADLRRAGLISYRYGHIRVLNCDGLKNASCECYGVIRTHLNRLHL
jgi:CRP-like cAMP-binding protein